MECGGATTSGAVRNGESWGAPRSRYIPGARPKGGRAGRRGRAGRGVMSDRLASPTGRVILRVELLGRLEVRTSRGTCVHLGGRHAPALFALLVLAGRPRSREAIAADLWPEADATSAGSLWQALWTVRHGLALAGLDPDAVLDIRPGVDRDPADRPARDRRARLRALPRRRGRLRGGAGDRAVPRRPRRGARPRCFAAERERLADRFEDALVVVAQRRLTRGDMVGARRAAEQALIRDPLREEAHAILIVVHGLTGSRSRSSDNTAGSRRCSRVSWASRRCPRPMPHTGWPCATWCDGRWSRSPCSSPRAGRPWSPSAPDGLRPDPG